MWGILADKCHIRVPIPEMIIYLQKVFDHNIFFFRYRIKKRLGIPLHNTLKFPQAACQTLRKVFNLEKNGGNRSSSYSLGPLMPGEKGKPFKTIGIRKNFADSNALVLLKTSSTWKILFVSKKHDSEDSKRTFFSTTRMERDRHQKFLHIVSRSWKSWTTFFFIGRLSGGPK